MPRVKPFILELLGKCGWETRLIPAGSSQHPEWFSLKDLNQDKLCDLFSALRERRIRRAVQVPLFVSDSEGETPLAQAEDPLNGSMEEKQNKPPWQHPYWTLGTSTITLSLTAHPGFGYHGHTSCLDTDGDRCPQGHEHSRSSSSTSQQPLSSKVYQPD